MGDSKRKRITMKLKRPNPLFENWLTEWRDKAKKENSKMEFCFNMALQSLKRYPLPLDRGRDCKILKGFGDKLCLMIDNKLRQHQFNMSNNFNDTIIGNMQTIDEDSKPLKKKKSKSPARSSSPKNKTISAKEYLPKQGSGGYAILITLYTQSLDPTYPGFLYKQNIIKEGQHLSHTSFTKPDPGSRYTAWSSMRALLSNKLVNKKSNPPKFSLSDEGLVLAKKLFENGKNSDCNTNSSSQSFKNDGHIVKDVQSEVICIDLSDDELISPKFNSYPVHVTDFSSKKLFTQTCSDNEIGGTSVTSTQHSVISESDENFRTKSKNMIEKHVSTSSETFSIQSSVISCSGLNKDKKFEKYMSSSSGYSSIQSSVISSEIKLNNKGKGKTIQKHASSSSIASSTTSQDECFIFPPNSFDVILYIDTCETSGSNVVIQDDPILAELQLLQVSYEVKKLKIGDYLWICRDRNSEHELVLPFIIERKRMDDFGQSIKDGRYHEQKFRLKKCGIQNITYLIEKYGSNQHVGLPVSTLYQAATNTAIQDGFCVKFTQNIRDTARYLANFSSVLAKMFQSKTLVSCPKENMSDICVEDDLISIMSFKEFNHTSSKNKPMKASDLFVKMLLQIKGISVDRALAIVERYPTPAELKKAYNENPGTEGEKLLSSIQFGDCSKSIGPVISKIVYQLFTLRSFN